MKRLTTFLAAIAVITTSGCSAWFGDNLYGQRRAGSSTSLVGYLYPEGEIPPDVTERVPHLQLPLKVGLAFVPARNQSYIGPSPADRLQILEGVRAQFEGLDYVDTITVIPETYLRGAQGVSGMQQVARVFDVDVMALISYDQVTTTSENTQSLLYWTIVGAYVFEGTDHDTRTFVDLAVIDVATSKLLLRAPGFDERRGDVTLVRQDASLRRNSGSALKLASERMQSNLAVELVAFEERLKSEPEDVKVSWRSGGGAIGWLSLALVSALLMRRRRSLA